MNLDFLSKDYTVEPVFLHLYRILWISREILMLIIPLYHHNRIFIVNGEYIYIFQYILFVGFLHMAWFYNFVKSLAIQFLCNVTFCEGVKIY